MNPWTEIAPGDGELVRIVDAALAEAARKAGPWLVCRPGCTPCCIGPFLINPLDALRLRQGLVELASADPERAERVRERARQSVARISSTFPGDTTTGIVDESEEAMEAFADFAGD
ncbi:MAG: YkgJ family cysteine cluster protein, partial [Bryobacteraceae bacterium]